MAWTTTNATGTVFGDLPHVSGRFYDSRIQSAFTTLALSADTLYGVPFYVPTSTAYTSIAIEVTTLSSGRKIFRGRRHSSTSISTRVAANA